MLELSGFPLTCLVLLVGHCLGDFAFQSTWMVMEKSKSWEVLFYHVLVYTASVVFAGLLAPHAVTLTVCGVLAVFVSHFFIDTWVKGRWGVTEKIWIDQLCHVSVLVALAWVGWL